MMVPARPTPYLLLVQPRFAFGRLDLGLDDPAGGRHLGQRQQRRVRRGLGEVVAQLAADLAQRPALLPRHANRFRALLGAATFIEDEDVLRRVQTGRNVRLHALHRRLRYVASAHHGS